MYTATVYIASMSLVHARPNEYAYLNYPLPHLVSHVNHLVRCALFYTVQSFGLLLLFCNNVARTCTLRSLYVGYHKPVQHTRERSCLYTASDRVQNRRMPVCVVLKLDTETTFLATRTGWPRMVQCPSLCNQPSCGRCMSAVGTIIHSERYCRYRGNCRKTAGNFTHIRGSNNIQPYPQPNNSEGHN